MRMYMGTYTVGYMLWPLVLYAWYSLAALGSATLEEQYTNHDPDSLIIAGTKCAEAYLENELTTNRDCIRLKHRIDSYKNMKAYDVFVKHADQNNETSKRIYEVLSEPNIIKCMREELFIGGHMDTNKLNTTCNPAHFPYVIMREMVNVYEKNLWSTLNPRNTSGDLLNLVFERLDQLAAAISFCGRIRNNDTSYLVNIRRYLGSLKEKAYSAFEHCGREKTSRSFYKYDVIKKDFDTVYKFVNEKKYEVKRELVQKYYMEWGSKISVDHDDISKGVQVFSTLNELAKTGTCSPEKTRMLVDTVSKGLNFAAQLVPLPFVATCVSIITAVVGFGFTSQLEQPRSEIQILSEDIKKEFAKLTENMNKKFKQLSLELQDQNLLNHIIIPGQIIAQAIEEYNMTRYSKNILNVCNSMAKNQLFAGMEGYVLDEERGYFAKTMHDHGTIPMFEQIKSITSKYMLDAIYAQSICHGMSSVNAWFENGKLEDTSELGKLVLEDGEKDPYIVYIVKKYQEINEQLLTMRPLIETNAMQKAEEFLKTSLKNLDVDQSTWEGLVKFTEHVCEEITRRWSIEYEFAIMWGEISHFTITSYRILDKKERYTTSNVIISREFADSHRSYAIMRKKKSITKRNRHNPLYEYRRRWDLHRWLPKTPIHIYDEEKCRRELSLLPKRTRVFEAPFCENELNNDWTKESLPPFIAEAARGEMFDEGRGWRVVTEDNSYSDSYDIVYAMGRMIPYATGSDNFNVFRTVVGTSMYMDDNIFRGAKERYSEELLASIEIDPLTHHDKSWHRDAWQY